MRSNAASISLPEHRIEQFTRLKTLGVDYAKALAARIAGRSDLPPTRNGRTEKIQPVFDVRNNIKAAAGAGFTIGRKLNNQKQAAKLNFLTGTWHQRL